jgi:hypothetical protein
VLHEALGVLPIEGIDGDADASGGRDLVVVDANRSRQGSQDATRDISRLLGRGNASEQHRELVPAEP